MKIIHCDLCGKQIGDVTADNVEMKDSVDTIRIGASNYRDVCGKCYKIIYEFVEELKKKK